MTKHLYTLALALLLSCPISSSVSEYSVENLDLDNYASRDLIISNNFNLTGIMCFSGAGVDFLDINGITQSATISNSSNVCIFRNSGAAATLTLTLPASENLGNGQVLYISSNDANLTLNLVAGLGTSFGDSVTTTPSSRGIMLTYRQADTTWYQLA